MSKTINLEYYVKDICFNPKQMSKEDPDRAKVMKAIQLLKKADKCTSELDAEKLTAQALAAISPLELEVNTVSDEIFDDSPAPDLVLNDENSSVSMAAEEGRLSITYSVRFAMGLNSDVTEETYEEWLGEGGWDWVGITFASEGYESDGGSSMSYSIDDDE